MRLVHVATALTLTALAAAACDRRDSRPGQTETTGATQEKPQQDNTSTTPSPALEPPPTAAAEPPAPAAPPTGVNQRDRLDKSGTGTPRGVTTPSAPSIETDDKSGGTSPRTTSSASADHTHEGSSSASERGEGNRSTTLGNGKSGMYTGGEGTYGGKATKGTGKPDAGIKP